ncbi:NADPH-dependent FMN reductase [Flavicella marina]|uniref:NADPH-dependent FMN reductase n=1 Tax=Flavicella marina TaxID=1475951 RepID=UPI0012651AFC|nr:NAD(P)H-dependent oxidoreductase [Flavicella marina]
MKNIIVIGGSNSKNSINKTLATHAAEQLEDVVLTVVDLNEFKLPLYGIDLETEEGIHEEAKRLNGVFDWADGFVVSLAEHNGAYSAAFKNAFDWLSRINGKVWREKPLLLLATSPGGRGGQTVLQIAANSFPHLGAKVTGSLSFPSFYDNFKDGEVVNSELKVSLEKEITNFQKEI